MWASGGVPREPGLREVVLQPPLSGHDMSDHVARVREVVPLEVGHQVPLPVGWHQREDDPVLGHHHHLLRHLEEAPGVRVHQVMRLDNQGGLREVVEGLPPQDGAPASSPGRPPAPGG